MIYNDKMMSFVGALALGVTMMGLAGAASASTIHVLTNDGRVLLTNTQTGATSEVNKIDPLEGPDNGFSPNSLGFFDGRFYATTFNSSGNDETIYSFDKNTTSGNFKLGTFSPGNVSAFAAGDANADGFSVVNGGGDKITFDQSLTVVGTQNDLTDDNSIFGDIAFDTFSSVMFASYNKVLERFNADGTSEKKGFNRYVGLAFDELGELFGVSRGGGIFALDFDAGSSTQTSGISSDVLGGAELTDAASVAPVPLPAAGWLMIAGLGGLAALRRRKRAG
ncbi:VPLPA-CTERM sorting domain-containing protein [Roseovarius tibetensis]|uniref:VPLPA-CTERM sorting domain-containing protein n=1 Tax=Roseovarius tibetensis TaxID=2685897 RepID=UPI003D7FBF83